MITKPISWTEPEAAPGQPRKDESAVSVALGKIPRPISPPHTLRARGKDVGALVFLVLTATELGSVYAGAHKATKADLDGDEAKGYVAYEEIYLEQKALHLVALACRQPDDPKFPTFFNAKDVRDNLTDDEIGVVLAAYNIFRREVSPIQSVVDEAEAAAWYAMLSKGKPNRMALSRLSSEALIDLVLYAAEERRKASEPHEAEPSDGAGGTVAPDVAAPATA